MSAATSSSPGLTVRRFHRLGLRRILLPKKDGQHNQGPHGEKLALPVLKGFEPELGASQMFPQSDGRFSF